MINSGNRWPKSAVAQWLGREGRSNRAAALAAYGRILAALACLVLAWQLITTIAHISENVFPSPTATWRAYQANDQALWTNTVPTVQEALIGLGAGIVLGIPLGFLLAAPGILSNTVYPLVLAAQSLPKVVLAPLFVIWFGFGSAPKYLFVFLLTFFPVAINATAGARSIPHETRELTRICRMSRWFRIGRVVLPWAMPEIFSGIKIATTFAVTAAIVGEFVGANEGLGYLIVAAQGNLETPLMFAGVIMVTLIGLLLYGLVLLIERLVIPWHASQRIIRS